MASAMMAAPTPSHRPAWRKAPDGPIFEICGIRFTKDGRHQPLAVERNIDTVADFRCRRGIGDRRGTPSNHFVAALRPKYYGARRIADDEASVGMVFVNDELAKLAETFEVETRRQAPLLGAGRIAHAKYG
ncbi:hypothetical protein LZC95_51890 [Pendulispora brunnea]|uniref:Uncharacterized protein n=1 Tax=Pendulispora brunnea TaxID=2905690 RepID=A0ABZ2KDH9_9BACT